MLDWSFNDFECLPLLVSLLLNEETSASEESLDDLYNEDKKQLSLNLWKSKETECFLNSILDAIGNGLLVTEKPYSKKQLTKTNLASVFVEPVSFFRWAEEQNYSLTYNIRSNVDRREKDLRIKQYKNYLISKEEVTGLMHEPLWFVSHAIMYLHGFKPMEYDSSSYHDQDPNASIINSDKKMKLINEYLQDANKLNDIQIYQRSGSKIKPREFMEWAGKLKLSFSNLISDKNTNEQRPIKTRERDTLLKLIIGMAVEQYGFDPKSKRNEATGNIQSDLESCGLSMDADTILKKLREASDLLPTQREE